MKQTCGDLETRSSNELNCLCSNRADSDPVDTQKLLINTANCPVHDRAINNSSTGKSVGAYRVVDEFMAKFEVYDEKDETTIIQSITFYKKSKFMTLFVVPLLSLATAFIFPLFMYWYPSMRLKVLYSKVRGIDQKPSHVLVEGFGAKTTLC